MNTTPSMTPMTAPKSAIASVGKPTYTPSPAMVPISGILAPKILLMGAPGTGKTWSIATLLQAGLEVFVIFTEPNGLPNLLNVLKQKKIPIDKLHWAYVPPISADWATVGDAMKLVNEMNYSTLADLKSGIGKGKSNSIMKLLNNLKNFHDDRTNMDFGDVTDWGYDRALVLDSLSGLNMLSIQNTVGLKPTMHQGEWGIAMNMEEMLINTLISSMSAYFILLAHVDRNHNEVTSQSIITPSAIGAKLGPKLGRFFSEVILAKRVKDQFTWSTSELASDVKQSTLPIKDGLEPSFKPIIDTFNLNIQQIRT